MESFLRNRIKKGQIIEEKEEKHEIKEKKFYKKFFTYKSIFIIIIILSLLTRFYNINHPSEVVFDEVHFGKFMSMYLRRTYFFDVHPPFSKLLFAFFGWLIGYDGHFFFESIGDSYIKNSVPYMYIRFVPAFFGAMVVPLVFLIMMHSGHSLLSSTLAAFLVLFDNAQVTQSRLILLDSILIFLMTSTLYCYIRFCNIRYLEFSFVWWKWLLLTGLSLSCTISTKYVGLFTYITIGTMVAIDLWDLLDIRKGYTLNYFAKHFIARAISLIIFPFILYLLWFYIHFTVLSKTGPGDRFMTPSFQETLDGNTLSSSSIEVNYYDKILIKHKETNAFLHSHTARYPLRYTDGRVSSQGQQVTAYIYNDTNNYWIIEPDHLFNNRTLGKHVLNNDYIRLKHVSTNTYLLTHDVASPRNPANQEFTTISNELKNRYNETVFQIKCEHDKNNSVLKTKGKRFKLIHKLTGVAMWSNKNSLPDWAFKQQEVNGNKNIKQENNVWLIDEVIDMNDTSREIKNYTLRSLPFHKKYVELQLSMFRHNNLLTKSHPYSSYPMEWPILNRGISFWTKESESQQIYLLGNPFGWWFIFIFIVVFVIIIISDQILLRRGLSLIKESRELFYNYTTFFFFSWILHYLPFYLMGRQLFLHHYLPAHICSALLSGSLFQLLFEKNSKSLLSSYFLKKNKDKENIGKEKVVNMQKKANIMFTILTCFLLGCFIYFSPLTYGKPGLTSDELYKRKWSSNWVF
ncbi:hypothetical protein T552_01296 [Pneumocystis carinii B80]|uniref:Dolichyl-phosphate-mannose--protein mannosyltransferase n=1 Tax=Pneumocystis carinii (strain B80) TaxID=1408658 RepID=A0A0W4ZLT8_PNEC8|nr:hypothetical protein T552_01296 [Pneumocystis carinii B80]KTW29341.1 hypothetical protein T552_01296 [Pneumocystis carinii B80]